MAHDTVSFTFQTEQSTSPIPKISKQQLHQHLCDTMRQRSIVACGGNARTIQIWDAISGILLRTLKGHDGCVNSIARLKDGGIVSGSDDLTVKIWNLAGICVSTLKGHTAIVRSVIQLSTGHIASASHDTTIRLWEPLREKCIKVLLGHPDQVLSIVEVNNGILASSGSSGEIRLWDIGSGQCINVLKGHEGPIYSLIKVHLLDGNLTSAGYDGTIRVWNVDEVKSAISYKSTAKAWAVSSYGTYLVSGHDDGFIRLWDKDCISQVKAHPGVIRAIDVSQNLAVTGGGDGTVSVWTIDPMKGISLLKRLKTKQNVWCVIAL
jgi:WD40 repeat protein